MAKAATFIRDVNSGVGQNGITVAAKRHVDDSTLTTATTGGAGSGAGFASLDVGYPGPHYLTATIGSDTLILSSKDIGFIGTISGSDIATALRAFTDGVVVGLDSELAVTADGTSLVLTVATGAALLLGHPWRQTASSTVTLGAADPTNPRIDRVVVSLVPPGQPEEGKITLGVLAGTPAVSPAAPALTQSTTLWQISLAQARVAAGATSVSGGNVTDERISAGPRLAVNSLNAIALIDASIATAKLADGSVTDAKLAAGIDAVKLGIGTVTNTELGYLDGVTSAVQTQLNGKSAVGHTHVASAVTDFSEAVDDRVAALLVQGSGIGISYNDTANTLTISNTQGSAPTIVVQEGDVTVVAALGTLDFDANAFNVTQSPTGEANVAAAFGSGAGTVAEGNHTHAHGALTGVDTDGGVGAIHHTLGGAANQAAAGNHNHDSAYLNASGDTVTGDLTINGTLTINRLHLGSPAPTLTFYQGCSGSLVWGNDNVGQISLTTSAGMGSGLLFDIVFSTARASTRYAAFLSPADPDSAGAYPVSRVYQDPAAGTTTTCNFKLPSGSLLSNGTTYVFNYRIEEAL